MWVTSAFPHVRVMYLLYVHINMYQSAFNIRFYYLFISQLKSCLFTVYKGKKKLVPTGTYTAYTHTHTHKQIDVKITKFDLDRKVGYIETQSLSCHIFISTHNTELYHFLFKYLTCLVQFISYLISYLHKYIYTVRLRRFN